MNEGPQNDHNESVDSGSGNQHESSKIGSTGDEQGAKEQTEKQGSQAEDETHDDTSDHKAPKDETIPKGYKQLLLGVGIVVLVLVAAAIAGFAVTPDHQTRSLADAPDPDEPPEPFVTDVRSDRIEAEGSVNVNKNLTVDGGHEEQTVLIEETGAFDQTDIRPLVSATTTAGHEIRFRDTQDLDEELDDADTYVLIDPRSRFQTDEVDAITDFTEDGGRLIILGNPDRVAISTIGLGISSRETVQTDMREVAGQYGIVFGNRYLYDMSKNDVTYRHVFAESTEETGSADSEFNIDRVVLPTATHVESESGTVLLRTPATTELSDGGPADSHPVAVREENVLAIGNTRFLATKNHNVAGTEDFVTYVVEFAIEGA